MSVIIYLEPLDTLFFRDSRPFIAGEDTLAESGLPSPLTLYGVIGDYILKKINKPLEDFINEKQATNNLGKYDENLSDPNAKLKIKGIFLIKEKTIYFPPPTNVYYYGNKITPNLEIFSPKKENGLKWDIEHLNLNPIIITNRDAKPLQAFIKIDTVKNYLLSEKNKIKNISAYLPNEFFQYENRYGQFIKETKTVEHLYSAKHLRFSEELDYKDYIKAGIAVLVDGLDKFDFTDSDTLSIGGERKRAKITLDNADILSCLKNDEIKKRIEQTKKFFVYFITPVIFNAGWISKEFLQKFNGAQLVGAVVNKPIYISGWIRKTQSQGEPRPIRKAVPAGSVYFFSVKENSYDFNDIYSKYNLNESLSDIYPNAGFGIALIGAWDY